MKTTIFEQIMQGIKPDGMSQIVFDYAKRTKKLDEILNVLTRQFCLENCAGTRGCCFPSVYRLGASEEMLLYQESEGTQQPNCNEKCKYHSNECGCTLTFFKPPICINLLCEGLKDYMKSKYGEAGTEFIKLMAKTEEAWSCLTYECKGKNLFRFMDKAILAGRKIVDKNMGGGK